MEIQDLMNLYPQIYHFVKNWLEHPKQIIDYITEAKEKTAYYKYGIGGQCVHRGVMCADPFWEMDSNVTRGKLKEREPKRSNYYRYSFNSEGCLLMVEKYCEVDVIEILRWEGNIVYGFMIPVRCLQNIHPIDVTIYGNVLVEGRIEAQFYTAKTYLDVPFNQWTLTKNLPQFYGNVIAYEDDLPIRYYREFDTRLEFDGNGVLTNIQSGLANGYCLYLNDDGDVINYQRIEHDGSLKEIRQLERAIPREQWDNCHGLI